MAKQPTPGRSSVQAGSSRRKRATLLRAGDLCLDLDAKVLLCNGAPCKLRPMEYKLIEVFMRHQGETLTRSWLMKAVWETDYDQDTRTLEVHISHLRKRIGDHARNSVYLHTVRGVGYCFEWRGEATPTG